MTLGRRKLGALAIVALALAAASVAARTTGLLRSGPAYADARAVVDRHCVGCHSEAPSVPAFPIAAGGIMLDTADEMQRYAERIRARAVVKQDMPLLNKTGMTDADRALLDQWITAGAKGP